MDQATFLWTLASAFFAGVQLFFQKIVAEEGRDSALNGFFMYGLSGLFALALQFSLYPLPDQWLIVGIFGFLGGAIHAGGNYIRIEALKYIHSVIYFPINKMLGPLLVLLGGVLVFGDTLTGQQYFGIALGLGVPLLLISSVEHLRQKNLEKGLVFVVLSTTLTSLSILVTKEAIILGPALLFIIGMSQLGGTLSSAAILAQQSRGHVLRFLAREKRDIHLGLIASVLGFLSTFTLLKALETGLIGIVYSIHAHYILIPIVLSVWWYREHINARKIIAIVISLLAIMVLYSA